MSTLPLSGTVNTCHTITTSAACDESSHCHWDAEAQHCVNTTVPYKTVCYQCKDVANEDVSLGVGANTHARTHAVARLVDARTGLPKTTTAVPAPSLSCITPSSSGHCPPSHRLADDGGVCVPNDEVVGGDSYHYNCVDTPSFCRISWNAHKVGATFPPHTGCLCSNESFHALCGAEYCGVGAADTTLVCGGCSADMLCAHGVDERSCTATTLPNPACDGASETNCGDGCVWADGACTSSSHCVWKNGKCTGGYFGLALPNAHACEHGVVFDAVQGALMCGSAPPACSASTTEAACDAAHCTWADGKCRLRGEAAKLRGAMGSVWMTMIGDDECGGADVWRADVPTLSDATAAALIRGDANTTTADALTAEASAAATTSAATGTTTIAVPVLVLGDTTASVLTYADGCTLMRDVVGSSFDYAACISAAATCSWGETRACSTKVGKEACERTTGCTFRDGACQDVGASFGDKSALENCLAASGLNHVASEVVFGCDKKEACFGYCKDASAVLNNMPAEWQSGKTICRDEDVEGPFDWDTCVQNARATGATCGPMNCTGFDFDGERVGASAPGLGCYGSDYTKGVPHCSLLATTAECPAATPTQHSGATVCVPNQQLHTLIASCASHTLKSDCTGLCEWNNDACAPASFLNGGAYYDPSDAPLILTYAGDDVGADVTMYSLPTECGAPYAAVVQARALDACEGKNGDGLNFIGDADVASGACAISGTRIGATNWFTPSVKCEALDAVESAVTAVGCANSVVIT